MDPTGDEAPAFRSVALRDLPLPDYVDLIAVPRPPGSTPDPATWARTIFGRETMPGVVKGLFGVRQALAPLIGVPTDPDDPFAVREVVGEEALLSYDDRHLDFRCGIGVGDDLVRVTTAVRLHGWRGRVYFGVVRPAHPLVVTAMLRRAATMLS
ncbi:MAG: DUF2867 domain-containing protein [Nocardioides sp.]|uniref:DUF2867 domain-containing protein n=1 Tax=Nocardioides sp. TaxID=35761 RepID=UPI0039E51354